MATPGVLPKQQVLFVFASFEARSVSVSCTAWPRLRNLQPLNKCFGEDWAPPYVTFSSTWSAALSHELRSDIRKVILPQLVDKVGYMSIPRIKHMDDALD
ncbi:hypothetical protein HGRIS_014887 [Hohenbuehelia grisea]|uniref:HAM1-like N-terminal domain-containing protein n=1 Tax=Hohenbuehelia grisea TaxID=104357 RepID=A0ABR3IR33_9AGAR